MAGWQIKLYPTTWALREIAGGQTASGQVLHTPMSNDCKKHCTVYLLLCTESWRVFRLAFSRLLKKG